MESCLARSVANDTIRLRRHRVSVAGAADVYLIENDASLRVVRHHSLRTRYLRV